MHNMCYEGSRYAPDDVVSLCHRKSSRTACSRSCRDEYAASRSRTDGIFVSERKASATETLEEPKFLSTLSFRNESLLPAPVDITTYTVEAFVAPVPAFKDSDVAKTEYRADFLSRHELA